MMVGIPSRPTKEETMATKNATTQSIDVQEALLDDPHLLRELLRTALQEILEAEMTAHLGAKPHERTDARTGRRNGYKPHTLKTRVGAMTLTVPQDRDGSFSTKLFARYQRTEKALVLALMEMYVVGVSTRKLASVTEELCGTTFSKSTVSALCGRLDGELNAWRTRSLSEHTWPYLFVDARYERVRRAHRVVSQGVLIAYAVRDDGFREIVAVECADTESEATYQALFADLKTRGLSGVALVVKRCPPGPQSRDRTPLPGRQLAALSGALRARLAQGCGVQAPQAARHRDQRDLGRHHAGGRTQRCRSRGR
jgi:putative transposase